MRSASRQFRGSFVAPTKLRCNDTRAALLRGLIGYELCPSIRSIMHIARLRKLHTAIRRIRWISRMPERSLERSGYRCISDSNLKYVAGSVPEKSFLPPPDKSRPSRGGGSCFVFRGRGIIFRILRHRECKLHP